MVVFISYVVWSSALSHLCLYRHPTAEGEYLFNGLLFSLVLYQKPLGDLHNLFGDTCFFDVYLTEDGFIKLSRYWKVTKRQEVLNIQLSYNGAWIDENVIKIIVASSPLSPKMSKVALLATYKKSTWGTYLTFKYKTDRLAYEKASFFGGRKWKCKSGLHFKWRSSDELSSQI